MTYEDALIMFRGALLVAYAVDKPQTGLLICGGIGQTLHEVYPEIDFPKACTEVNEQVKRKFDAKNKAKNEAAN